MKRTSEAKLSRVEEMVSTGIPVRLHLRTDLHLARKVWHMTMGLFAVAVYSSGMSRTTAVFILCSVLGFNLLVEMARLRAPSFNDKFMRICAPIMRSSEANKLSGVPYYLASMILAIGIFPRPIAILSIIYLACGDPIASLFGIIYGDRGKRFANGKSIIGTMAGVLTCAIVTFIFLSTLNLNDHAVLALTVVGGLAGGMAELLPLDVDDNFSIPIVSGFALWLAFILLGV
jgi:dolichol kinase